MSQPIQCRSLATCLYAAHMQSFAASGVEWFFFEHILWQPRLLLTQDLCVSCAEEHALLWTRSVQHQDQDIKTQDQSIPGKEIPSLINRSAVVLQEKPRMLILSDFSLFLTVADWYQKARATECKRTRKEGFYGHYFHYHENADWRSQQRRLA